MKTLILASGEGNRLKPLTESTNKGMLEVFGKPVLERIIDHLKFFGFTDIVMAVGIKKNQVKNYFGDGSRFGVRINYSESNVVQGTAGEVANAKKYFFGEKDFLIYYGDTLTNLDLLKFYDCHKNFEGVITIPGMKEIKTESGILVCKNGCVDSFFEKPFINDIINTPTIFSNVPVYFVSKRIWESNDVNFSKDMNLDVVPYFIKDGLVKLYFQKDLWHIDIGDLKKYYLACEAFKNNTQTKLRKLA